MIRITVLEQQRDGSLVCHVAHQDRNRPMTEERLAMLEHRRRLLAGITLRRAWRPTRT